MAALDCYVVALDAENGEVLWEQRTNSGITGVPSTYQLDGKQYVAVISGWGIDAATQQSMPASAGKAYPPGSAGRGTVGVRVEVAGPRQPVRRRPLIYGLFFPDQNYPMPGAS